MKTRFQAINLMLLLLVLSAGSQAQPQIEIDSLNSLLKALPKNDAKRLDIWGELSWVYATTRSETITARKYADSIHHLANALNDPRGQALAHFYYGGIDRFEGNFSEGLKHLNEFIAYQKTQGDSSRVALGLFQIGTIHPGMDDKEKGLKALYRALTIHEKNSDQSSTNYVLNAIGFVLKDSKRFDEAIEIFQRVLETDSLDSDVLMNLGNVYAILEQHDKALAYYQKALRIDRKLKWIGQSLTTWRLLVSFSISKKDMTVLCIIISKH